MDSVKKFTKYLLMFLAIYVLVSILSTAFINKAYKKLSDYEILTKSPKIEVVESKATYMNGYVIAKVTNDTGVEIDKTYLKLDLYSRNGTYLGSKYNEINDFTGNEVIEVKTNFKYNGVEKYKISITNNVTESEREEKEDLMSGLVHLSVIAGVIMIIYYIL